MDIRHENEQCLPALSASSLRQYLFTPWAVWGYIPGQLGSA
jgi:hypothetical protein